MFDQSSLEELIIHQLSFETTLISHENTNLKRLTISGNLLQPLAAVLPNITSLTYLRINWPVTDSDLLVLIDLVQSHTTLDLLELSIHQGDEYSEYDIDGFDILTNLPKLIDAADSCQKKLEIDEEYYKYLPNDNKDVSSDKDDNNEVESVENEYNEDNDSSDESDVNGDENDNEEDEKRK